MPRPPSSFVSRAWPFVVLLLFAVLLAAPMLRDLGGIANIEDDPDGRQQMASVFPLVDALWTHGEYPLWMPHFGGGVPWSGYLYNPGVSVISVVYLLAGAVAGPKIWSVLVLFGAGIGMMLALQLWTRLDRGTALLASMTVMASAWLPGRMYSGNYDESSIFLAPLGLVLLWGLLRGRWWGLLLPVLFSTLIAQAKFAPGIVAALLGIFLIASMWGQWRELGRAMLWLVVAFVIGLLISAPKLLPLMDLLANDLIEQSEIEDVLSYRSVGEVLHYASEGYERRPLSMKPNRLIGLGALGILIAIAAIGRAGQIRRLAPWGAITVVGTLLALGPASPLPIGEWLANLPLLDAMRNFAKYWNILILVGLGGMLGIGLEGLLAAIKRTRLPAWGHGLVVALVVAGLLVPTVYRSFRISREAFNVPIGQLPPEASSDAYFHVSVRDLEGIVDRYRSVAREDLVPANDMLHLAFARKGFIPWYGNLQFEENAVPRYYAEGDSWVENPAYPGGEVTSDDPAIELSDYSVTYNTIRFRAETSSVATVQVNMNHHPGWASPNGEVTRSEDGRIAITLPANHRGEVTLRFRDGRFLWGLLIGFVALGVWVVGFKLLRTVEPIDPTAEMQRTV